MINSIKKAKLKSGFMYNDPPVVKEYNMKKIDK